ncbi:hypothetical protein ACJA25_02195 [Mycoplasmopsis hyopharyngis]|uniref:hypothetical protein n=1 Tax=Mycoplasmopsis hyopharyngis TaxID=29558 RepID=UPI00387399DA
MDNNNTDKNLINNFGQDPTKQPQMQSNQMNFDPNAMGAQAGMQPNQMGLDPNTMNIQSGQMNQLVPDLLPQNNMQNGMFPTNFMPMPTNQFTYEIATAQPAFNPAYAMYDPNVAEAIKKKQKKKMIVLSTSLSAGALALVGAITGVSIYLKDRNDRLTHNKLRSEAERTVKDFLTLYESIFKRSDDNKFIYLENQAKTYENEINEMLKKIINSPYSKNTDAKNILTELKTKTDTFTDLVKIFDEYISTIKNIKDTQTFEKDCESFLKDLSSKLTSGSSTTASSFNKIKQHFKSEFDNYYDHVVNMLNNKGESTNEISLKTAISNFRKGQETIKNKINSLKSDISELSTIRYVATDAASKLFPSQFDDINQVLNFAPNSNFKNIHSNYYRNSINGKKTYKFIPNDLTGTLQIIVEYYYELTNPIDPAHSEYVLISNNENKTNTIVENVNNSKSIARDDLISVPKINVQLNTFKESKNFDWEDKTIIEQFKKFNEMIRDFIPLTENSTNSELFNKENFNDGTKNKMNELFSISGPQAIFPNQELKYSFEKFTLNNVNVLVEYSIQQEIITGLLPNGKFKTEIDIRRNEKLVFSINELLQISKNVLEKKNYNNETEKILDINAVDEEFAVVKFLENTVNKNYAFQTIEDSHNDIFDQIFKSKITLLKEFNSKWNSDQLETINKEEWKKCIENLKTDFKFKKETYNTKKKIMDEFNEELTSDSKNWKNKYYKFLLITDYLNEGFSFENGNSDSNNKDARMILKKEFEDLEKTNTTFLNSNKYSNNELNNKKTSFIAESLKLFKKREEHQKHANSLWNDIKKTNQLITEYAEKINKGSEEQKQAYNELKNLNETTKEQFKKEIDIQKLQTLQSALYSKLTDTKAKLATLS